MTTFVTAVYDLHVNEALGGRARGIGHYLLSLCSLAKMGAPFVVYTWPQHVDLLRRFAADERLTWDVVGVDLAETPHFARIQELRQQKGHSANPWHNRCHAVNLARGPVWPPRRAATRSGASTSTGSTPGSSDRRYFPDRFLGPEGFDCSLFTPDTLRALADHPGLLGLGLRDALRSDGTLHSVPVAAMTRLAGGVSPSTQIVGALFGGPCAELHAFGREYAEVVAELLAAGELGTDENVLTVVYQRRPDRFHIEPFATWHHEDSGTLRQVNDAGSFFRIFERFADERRAPAIARQHPSDVTVVLNTYKRPHTLRQQYDAVIGQTCAPAEVLVWQNFPDHSHAVVVDPSAFDRDVLNRCATVTSLNTNFGVWGRFAFALNARTTYVCVLDDDTIPGSCWLENCLETIATHRGLLGTVGIVQQGQTFAQHRRVGWRAPNEQAEAVDYVGHAWFFEREWLTTFWRELPPCDLFAYEGEPHALCAGEDMHFSYTLQKYLGLRTYVPPHPAADRSRWGSDPALAVKYGTDDAAASNLRGPHWKFGKAWEYYRARGFRFLFEG